ncbi:MAG: hypothetical protein HYR85_04380 [Planctomycetes bacterium]|nr:hypothetical protein [Planctomycetota bacterium]MBI3847040.1 hypothetical protein [Planctomycetota bacterium]
MRTLTKRGLPLLVAACVSSTAFAQGGSPVADESRSSSPVAAEIAHDFTLFPEFERESIHGYLWTRYRLRTSNRESDQDFFENLLLDVGDPKKSRLTASVLAELSEDVDGRRSPSALFSVKDTFSNNVNGRLLHAYVDLNHLGPIERIRGGRQESSVLPEVPLFDGATVESETFTSWNLRLRAFGGVPTHLYESSPTGDGIAAAGIEVEPPTGTWASFHMGRVRDELVLSTDTQTFAVLEASQRITTDLRVSGRATSLTAGLRDLDVHASYANSDDGWRGQVSYFALVRTQRELVTEFDPFFAVLKEEDAYSEWRMLLSKDLGERLTIEGGVWFRELRQQEDEGAFNHDFRRVYLTPTLHDWPLDDTDLSVTAELWEGENQAVRTYGLEASHVFSKDLRASLGSEYALFKFSPFFGEERQDVRTAFARAYYDVTESLRADVGVEFETDQQDSYRTLRVGLRWRF